MRRADYLEKGGGLSIGRLPAQNAQIELVSFTPGVSWPMQGVRGFVPTGSRRYLLHRV